MAEPKVFIDFELVFTHGVPPAYFTALEGRDAIRINEQAIVLRIHHEDGAVEDVSVNRSALAYARQVKRIEQPEPQPTVQ